MSTYEMFKTEGKGEGLTDGRLVERIETLFSVFQHSPESDINYLSMVTRLSKDDVEKLIKSYRFDTKKVLFQNIITWFFPSKETTDLTIQELKKVIDKVKKS